MMTITATEARRRLFPLIEQVNDDRVAIEITSKKGNAVLVAADEWASIQETAFLLSSPENARRLMTAVAQIDRGAYTERELDRDQT